MLLCKQGLSEKAIAEAGTVKGATGELHRGCGGAGGGARAAREGGRLDRPQTREAAPPDQYARTHARGAAPARTHPNSCILLPSYQLYLLIKKSFRAVGRVSTAEGKRKSLPVKFTKYIPLLMLYYNCERLWFSVSLPIYAKTAELTYIKFDMEIIYDPARDMEQLLS